MSREPGRLSRRDVLQHAAALGTALVAAPRVVLAQTAKLSLTPEQIMGPFYPVMKPLDRDADLTMLKGKPGRAQGKILNVMGRVLNGAGEPVAGAQIEIWQANAVGRYDHPRDLNPAALDPNFQGYAIIKTDKDGRYRYKTIKPAAYPINPMNPDTIRPPHIHIDVAGMKERLVTQMYFPDEPHNQQDPLFKELGKAQAAAIARVVPTTKEFEPDSLVMMWDIVLDKG